LTNKRMTSNSEVGVVESGRRGRREGRRRDVGASGEAPEMRRARASAVGGALESIGDGVVQPSGLEW
jgi:hypothetical protein